MLPTCIMNVKTAKAFQALSTGRQRLIRMRGIEGDGFRETNAGQVLSRKASFFSGAYSSWTRVRGKALLGCARTRADLIPPQFVIR